MKKVSLIIPCYNEEQALPIFAGELDKVRQELRQYDFEVLMVNDGSSDKTLETMKKISEEYDSSICHFPETLVRRLQCMRASAMQMGITWR